MGQTTKVERSTVEQVRVRIAYLREKTREASSAKSFDFEKRLAEVHEREAALREEKKAAKKALREQARVQLAQETAVAASDAPKGDSNMMAMMGFAGFGTTKK